LTVDRREVRRGERIFVTVGATGRSAATLWVRSPGEPWKPSQLALDSTGQATTQLGPLESDQYLRASSGGRTSETIRVRVALPSFLAELAIVARYPAYLGLADEPLLPGTDTVLVPVGTRITTHGRATVPLRSAGWTHDGQSTGLVAEGQGFSGVAVVTKRAEGTKCARSWKILTTVGADKDFPDVSPRDAQALREREAARKAARTAVS
jgi:hypothetical protein